MKLEDQVARVELAKELKELDVTQDSAFAWYQYVNCKPYIALKALQNSQDSIATYHDGCAECPKDICDTQTVAELGELLPSGFYSYYDGFDGWTCSSPWGFCDIPNPDHERLSSDTPWGPCVPARQNRYTEEAKTEADSRAKMLLLLIKKGLVKVEEVGK